MIALSAQWAPRLKEQPESGMGYQVATVVLKDGRRVNRVTIVGGTITAVEGQNKIPFVEADIADIVVTLIRN
jgi:hypothetical protein